MRSVQVSVIVPVFNGGLYIGRCIRSLLKQTMNQDDYEIIVVNDASNDQTKNVLETFIGDIKYFENQKRLGLPATLNTGIKHAKGQFIVRVDADDYVHWDYLKILSMHLQLNHSIEAIACDYLLVDNNQDILEYKNCEKDPIGCGIMFKLEHLIELGLYDEDFLAREEEDLLIRFKKKHSVTRVQLPLYRYRKHEKNLTNNKKQMKEFKNKLSKKHKIK
ncbi:MAG: putative glycosyltransferase EpsH [Alphaproteobacteria bacterium MarineAlpha5_Bin9]|nr:MAG: putative glycosyltransferase EpsH [Alphaproteobacteria bacterium MarineAlpha5_Bin9]|tara:strand:- start:13607 stop:14263 length:657 start_codon:yes stop_codon:yes gene_type:complete